MLLSEITLKIRADCPLFDRRVGGTAKFSNVVDAGMAEDMGVPAAFVVPLNEDPEEGENDQRTSTWVTENIAILVCVSNRVDRSRGSGVSASDTIRQAKNELYDALVSWRPLSVDKARGPKLQLSENADADLNDEESHEHFYEDVVPRSHMGGMRYRGAQHISMTPARLWHEFHFSVDYLKDKTDPAMRDVGGLLHELQRVYGGFSQDIGEEHIDDYDLLVGEPEEGEGD